MLTKRLLMRHKYKINGSLLENTIGQASLFFERTLILLRGNHLIGQYIIYLATYYVHMSS